MACQAPERLVEHRVYYSFDAGSIEPTKHEVSPEELSPIGSSVVGFAGAPGIGWQEWLITRHDEQGAWGRLVRDTTRILTPEETR